MIQIKEKYISQIKQGVPLLSKQMLCSKVPPQGEVFQLIDGHKNYLGTAYSGLQHKGIGWIITKNPTETIDRDFFYRKFYSAFNKRRSFFFSKHTNAFRLFNDEGDGIGGLTIDYYNGRLLISFYSKGIAQFQKPILGAIDILLENPTVYAKHRYAEADIESEWVHGDEQNEAFVIKENHVAYWVELNHGAMTGIFLDQREVRQAIKKSARGKNVLNLFSYTSAFSVAAAMGGAKRTVNVDLANRSIEYNQKNYDINQCSVGEIVISDVFQYLRTTSDHFDYIIIDPPSFSTTGKGQQTFRIQSDYPQLISAALPHLSEGGQLVCSTNHARISRKKFLSLIEKGFHATGRTPSVQQEFSLPSDFRTQHTSPYLKVFFVQ